MLPAVPSVRSAGTGRGRPGRRAGTHILGRMSEQTADQPMDPEDRKLVTLARSARARNGVAEGAAVRDETGRTYVAGSVELASLQLSALRTAVAMAVASGAKSLEAGAVVTEAELIPAVDLKAVHDLAGQPTQVLMAGTDGGLRATVTTD
jgi:cytidine deaminase